MTTKAAFRDGIACGQPSPEASACDERSMIQTPSPHTQASFFEDINSYDTKDAGTMETPPTSFASSPGSILSPGYHRGYNNPNETTWIKNSFCSWLAGSTDESVSSSMVNCVHSSGWLDSESSSPVSMASNEQVLDALATSLAPARPQMIHLGKELHDLPASIGSSELNLRNRPGTPFEFSGRRMTNDHFSLLSLSGEANERSTVRNATKYEKEHEADVSSSQVTLDSSQDCASSTAGSLLVYEEQPQEHQHYQNRTIMTSNSKSIIDSIYETLKDFPQYMLFLDTPCVVELRRQNHAALERSATKSSHNPSPSSSVYEKRFSKFFAPWLRSSPSTPSSHQKKVSSAVTTPLPTGNSSDSKVSTMTDPPSPDLAAFQRIFPTTQVWWQSVLYAQLVAYNYIRTNQVSSRQNRSGISPKACRTLGILEQHSILSMADHDWDAKLDEVEKELVSCITWITNCMSGNRAVRMDQESVQRVSDRDFVLIRSLAEIVNISEGVLNKEFKTQNVD